jgi:hypothetical protein
MSFAGSGHSQSTRLVSGWRLWPPCAWRPPDPLPPPTPPLPPLLAVPLSRGGLASSSLGTSISMRRTLEARIEWTACRWDCGKLSGSRKSLVVAHLLKNCLASPKIAHRICAIMSLFMCVAMTRLFDRTVAVMRLTCFRCGDIPPNNVPRKQM